MQKLDRPTAQISSGTINVAQESEGPRMHDDADTRVRVHAGLEKRVREAAILPVRLTRAAC